MRSRSRPQSNTARRSVNAGSELEGTTHESRWTQIETEQSPAIGGNSGKRPVAGCFDTDAILRWCAGAQPSGCRSAKVQVNAGIRRGCTVIRWFCSLKAALLCRGGGGKVRPTGCPSGLTARWEPDTLPYCEASNLFDCPVDYLSRVATRHGKSGAEGFSGGAVDFEHVGISIRGPHSGPAHSPASG